MSSSTRVRDVCVLLCVLACVTTLWHQCSAKALAISLDESERWRQSVAVRLTTRGPDRPFDVLRTRRDSSVTVTFKRAISNVLNSSAKCNPSRHKRCILASHSPGVVGKMNYQFKDASRKIQGHSTQVFLACRCLDFGCREAIVLEPRRVQAEQGKPSRLVCTYPRAAGRWRDCHTELLRLQQTDVSDVFSIPESNQFVVQLGPDTYWNTTGRRKYVRPISSNRLGMLQNISFQSIISSFKQKARTSSTDEFYVFGNDTAGELQYPRDSAVESEDGDECAKLFNFAQRSADWMGAQQDQLAIARNEDSFLIPRPDEPSSSDAFLAIGTGLTGLFASIGIWSHVGRDVRRRGSRGPSKRMVFWVVFKVLLALFVIGVEVATLVFAWATQNAAQNWSSFFTWFDASVALSSSVEKCQPEKETFCSAARSVYVVAGLMGTATAFHPNRTKWKVLLLSMVFIIAASLVFVFAFFRKTYQSCMRYGQRTLDPVDTESVQTTLLVSFSRRDRRRIRKSPWLTKLIVKREPVHVQVV